ncbi:hypothetical protein BDV36DRAFT_284843 [Aspergillus pseudocaelatus]|uniref:DUF7580 domain-containing protein n=1 Tax=Aspergillus pseudocaelatus TaxID=1825620 RepID=A0ABQ6WKM1_9EURO|nr:hypothetical protein BDV36DRAFT_284843 [Aspergillus pseudocaelatus]
MSGFEVVGVVLGAIPLIISAIDSYKATSQRIKFMVKKELLLNQLIQSLEEQKFYFQTDICLALKEAHLEEKQIIAQIDERGLNLFQDPEISDALKEYLGEGFTLYINAVARCEHILSDIIANISGLVATPQWDRNDLPTILQSQPKRNGRFEFTKRIKFNESTKTLSRLRDQSIARQNVTVQPMSRAIARFTTALNAVQSYAHRLLFLQTRSTAMNKNHSNPPRTPSPSLQLIEGLYQSIHQAYERRQSLDLYLSRCAKLCYSHGSVDPGININVNDRPSHDTITLKDALFIMQNSKFTMPKWTINQQMALSFNITSSMMQHHSTPWLATPLTSSSIRFTPDPMKFKSPPQPFIVSAFPTKSHATSPYTTKASMLELGIILLEIWHMRSIDNYASEKALKMDDSYGTRYEIARHWLNFSDDSMLPFYLELVTRYIECTFATTSATPDWDDLTFRKSVCEHVLKPLWENCPRKLW